VSFLSRLGRGFRRPHDRAGFALYAAAVAAARDPWFYTELAVPDTLDGRFDMVGAYVSLLIHRLRRLPDPGPALAQAAFDGMFSDMDLNLREIGVGDLSVGKRVRAMWEAFHGRALAYQAALDAGDLPALAAALSRNVWRGADPPGHAERLAAQLVRERAALDAQDLTAFAAGRAVFPGPRG